MEDNLKYSIQELFFTGKEEVGRLNGSPI